MKTLVPFLLVLALSSGLTGCVVYMPMQCAAPQITDAKQAELSASSYFNGRYDLAATYSPVRHLLVRATYSNLSSDTKDTVYYRGRQYDVGMGTYWKLGDKWLLGGLGGFGQARSAAAFSNGGSLLGIGRPVRHEFDVHYNKVFGEVYGVFQASESFSLGAAYRITQVNFITLTDQRAPVDLNQMTRYEPMIFLRVRLGDGPTDSRPVQLQAAWGASGTFGYDARTDNEQLGSVAALKQGRGYTTIGISIFPQCLFRKAQVLPENR